MFIFLSKSLPLLIYPLGAACLLLAGVLVLERKGQSGRRWRVWLTLLALALLWLGGNRWVASALLRSLEWRYLPPAELQTAQSAAQPLAEVIMLLGGGTEVLTPPRPIAELNGAGDRLLYAAWLYHQGYGRYILVTGGEIEWQDNDSQRSAADDSADVLKMLGVPEDAIWLEGRSRNTYENAVYTRLLLEEKGYTTQDMPILLVTSAQHMPRSVGLYVHQGFRVIPAPTDYQLTQDSWEQLFSPNPQTQIINLLPSAGNLAATTNSLKEMLGMLIYRWRGWL